MKAQATTREVNDDDLVPKDWTDGKQMTVGEWGQREFDFGRKSGIDHAKACIVAIIREKAKSLFADGKDDDAKLWRGFTAVVNGMEIK